MAIKDILFLFVLVVANPITVSAQYSEEDWIDRDAWMKVSTLMELLNVSENDHVADVGCHEGYFSFHLSEKVGDGGKVYAVDVADYRIDALKQHIEDKGVTNIEAILGDFDNPKLPEDTLDAVIIMDTYHEMESYETIISHIKKALKPDGKLLVLEKLKKHKRGKSRKEQVAAHTLSSKYVKEELKAAGFEIENYIANFGYWKKEKDKQMWVLVAVPLQ